MLPNGAEVQNLKNGIHKARIPKLGLMVDIMNGLKLKTKKVAYAVMMQESKAACES